MQKDRGFTLLELMIVVAIIGILASVALPNMSQYMDNRRVVGAAEEIMQFLTSARSEAIARSKQVEVRIVADGTSTWAVGMEQEPAVGDPDCDPTVAVPTAADACVLSVSGADILRRIISTDHPNTNVATTAGTINFDPVRGTANVATITITNAAGSQLRVITSLTGRVRICRPNASGKRGYSAC